ETVTGAQPLVPALCDRRFDGDTRSLAERCLAIGAILRAEQLHGWHRNHSGLDACVCKKPGRGHGDADLGPACNQSHIPLAVRLGKDVGTARGTVLIANVRTQTRYALAR